MIKAPVTASFLSCVRRVRLVSLTARASCSRNRR